MADNGKKFYWLKLQRDFFKRHDIRIIESMPNGKDYILFYLKLLCESVDHDGKLRFSESIPYNEEMLATITNTNIDVVRSAVKIFTELGMMGIMDDGTYFMSAVEKMLGSGSDNANALRQRRWRENHRAQALTPGAGVTDNNGGVTDSVTKNNGSVTESVTDNVTDGVTKNNGGVTDGVTKNNESKSIEKEIEKEIENNVVVTDVEETTTGERGDALIRYASNNLRFVSQYNLEELISYRDSLTDDMIQWAIDESCAHGSRNYAYTRRILNSMVEKGYKTLGEVKAAEAKRTVSVAEARARANNPSKILDERELKDEDFKDWFEIKLNHAENMAGK